MCPVCAMTLLIAGAASAGGWAALSGFKRAKKRR
jgi:hypothetical protein